MDKGANRVTEFFQTLWSQALVTMSGAEDEAGRLLGKVQGMAGWSQDEGLRQVREYSERLTNQRREIERRMEDAVRQTVARLKVPRREELAQLSARLEGLAKRVEALHR